PVRDVRPLQSTEESQGAVALTAGQLRDLLTKLQASTYCREHDLVDPITMFAATGLRRSELLGLRWSDVDIEAGTVTLAGKLVRVKGDGLKWIPKAKSKSGLRTLPLPRFAVEMLAARCGVPYYGEQTMIFPSTAGSW